MRMESMPARRGHVVLRAAVLGWKLEREQARGARLGPGGTSRGVAVRVWLLSQRRCQRLTCGPAKDDTNGTEKRPPCCPADVLRVAVGSCGKVLKCLDGSKRFRVCLLVGQCAQEKTPQGSLLLRGRVRVGGVCVVLPRCEG